MGNAYLDAIVKLIFSELIMPSNLNDCEEYKYHIALNYVYICLKTFFILAQIL